MTTGTRSVLFGAHCFFLHPFFVAAAWARLYGFPWDPRLWVAFFVHDLGYIGKGKMDDEIGETHPLLGARIMLWLFGFTWYDFCLLHSRYYAKRLGRPVSRLCYADKLAFCLTPRWMYLPMVQWSGEIHEYLERAKGADVQAGHFKADDYSGRLKEWHEELRRYMLAWVEEHKGGAADTWTSADRHARSDSGVWQ